ncbi:MAG: pentapeptide repeat-containing protein, partial [Phycisphaerales bacterium]
MSDSEKPKSWKDRRQSIKHKWLAPFIFPEWLCERLSYFLGQWAFLEILGHAGRLTILIAVVTYFMGADERQMQATDQRKAKQYQAWQVINIAQGKPGGGGRKDALEDLNKDNVSLVGVDISKAFLRELNLAGAYLVQANLAEANLEYANLSRADLRQANLAGAVLYHTDLDEAYLSKADLTRVEAR